LIQNSDIFQPDLIYRPQDPYFGVANGVVYNHAYGLTASTVADYYSALYENHYWKNLVLGSIETAQARDSRGNVIYEVVYSRIVDNLVNNAGESVSKQVQLPYPVDYADQTDITTVYPNSLVNMRDQVIDTVGQISKILPLWMTSKQSNGQTLGFTPAWVIAYIKPGQAERVAYYVRTQFTQSLNLVDFEVDRYELDRWLTKNWDPVYDSTQGSWVPNPPQYTRFDGDESDSTQTPIWINNFEDPIYWLNDLSEPVIWVNDWNGEPTIFDGNSLQFIDPVDMYVGTVSNPQIYDKYLVFPKRNILE
jgi:hypothetical protein